ncbi:MAG: enoyl-CoA hydratase-related protein [Proteobacteria bacterium]|nr:enoyl-CoA hydratase-related protein [Pseudomonadota bacterium]
MSEPILVERDAGIATVTLDRPKQLNALSVEALENLAPALAELARDPAVRCVVLTGAGERAFSAGGDLKEILTPASRSPISPAEDEAMEAPMQRLRNHSEAALLLHEMPKPTLAVVNGVAAGASLSLALACDLRIAADTARFVTAFAGIGFSGDFGGSYWLTQVAGTAVARQLYFLDEPVDAARALELGIVNWVVPADGLRADAREKAERLAGGPPLAYRYMKRNLNLALKTDARALVDLEAEAMVRTGNSQDVRDGADAFLRKETPAFRGR